MSPFREYARAFRRIRAGIVTLLVLNVLTTNLIHTFSTGTDDSWRGCESGSTAWPGQRGWLSEKSKIFTKRWKHHRIRNVAVYACISTRKIPFLSNVMSLYLSCPEALRDARHDELFQVPSVCLSHDCLRRYGQSHYIYAEFVLKTYNQISSFCVDPPSPTEEGRIAVLVEPRKHPLLGYTVKQVMLTLGSSWALQLFVSSENEDYVRKSLGAGCGSMTESVVISRLSDFGLDSMSQMGNKVQSAFSAHQALYHAIKSEHILWFQVDVILRKSPDENLLQYAYVGSEWRGCEYPCSEAACSAICGGGNSGLSLRQKSKILPIATRGVLPHDLWGIGSEFTGHNYLVKGENAYFSSDEFCNNSQTRWFEDDLLLSYKLAGQGLLPNGDASSRFAIGQAVSRHGICESDPAGMHKPWAVPWIIPDVISELLQEPYDSVMSQR